MKNAAVKTNRRKAQILLDSQASTLQSEVVDPLHHFDLWIPGKLQIIFDVHRLKPKHKSFVCKTKTRGKHKKLLNQREKVGQKVPLVFVHVP